MRKSTRQTQGFTLLEVALVILTVGLVLGGMIRLLSIQNQYSVEQDELARLAQIKQALIGFVSLHGRLPCPDTDNDGKEDPNSPIRESKSCNRAEVGAMSLGGDYNQQRRVAVGLLPYVDLGVPRNNRYGHAYQYVVTLHYADTEAYDAPRFRDPTPFPYNQAGQSPNLTTRCPDPIKYFIRSSFSLCSRGGVKIVKKSVNSGGANSNTTVVQEHAPFAVISLGKDGESTTSAVQNIKYKIFSTPNNLNTNATSGSSFVRNRTVVVSDSTDKAFDHKVLWMSSSALAMAALQAGLVF